MDSLNGQRKLKGFLNSSLAAILGVSKSKQDLGDQAGRYKRALGVRWGRCQLCWAGSWWHLRVPVGPVFHWVRAEGRGGSSCCPWCGTNEPCFPLFQVTAFTLKRWLPSKAVQIGEFWFSRVPQSRGLLTSAPLQTGCPTLEPCLEDKGLQGHFAGGEAELEPLMCRVCAGELREAAAMGFCRCTEFQRALHSWRT